MKLLSQKIHLIVILFISMFIASCQGDDGEIGPQGPQGVQGEKGDQGDQGQAGEGFDELAQLGNISMTLTGVLPDGATFTKEMDYKFLPAEDVSSFVYHDGDDYHSFSITRFFSAPDDVYNSNYVSFEFSADESVNPADIVVDEFYIYSSIILGTKYFRINDNFTTELADGITNYSYNAETGALSLNFDFVIPAASNETGNDISVSGTVDVKVLEPIGLN